MGRILRLKVQGARTVIARDFDLDSDVEILTPDAVVATLDRDANMEMEVCVEQGRGYQPAEKREPEALPINAMLMDADFPIVVEAGRGSRAGQGFAFLGRLSTFTLGP